jgi:hypothetical protein
MALSTRLPSGADTAGFIAEQWDIDVLDIVKTKLIIQPTFDTTWTIGKKRGDTINVGVLNEPSATEVTVGTPGVTNDIATGSKTQITIDQWYESPVVIDEMTDLQSQVDLAEKAKEASAYAIAKKIDNICAVLFESVTHSAGTDGSALTDLVLMAAVELLDEDDAPDEGRVWMLDPSAKYDMLQIDKFVHADYGAGDVVPAGAFRKNVYGAPVMISNNLHDNTTGNWGCYYQKRAFDIAVQDKVTGVIVHEPLKHTFTINTTALWGVKQMRDIFACHIHTRLK